MVRNQDLQGIKNYPVISSINKLKKRKVAKGMSTFNFSMLYTKIFHDKLLYVLNEIIDFAFMIQEHFGHGSKV